MGSFPRLNLPKAHFIVGPYCSMLLDKWAPTGVIKIRNVTVNRFFFQPTCVLTGHTATILSSLPFPIQLPPLPFLTFHNPPPLPPSLPPMSTQRARASRVTDDEINDLILKLQALLPHSNQRRTSTGVG